MSLDETATKLREEFDLFSKSIATAKKDLENVAPWYTSLLGWCSTYTA